MHLPLTHVVHLLPCCCRPEGDTRSGGTINISSISSGKCAATLGGQGSGLRTLPLPLPLPLAPTLTPSRCVAKLAAGDAMPQLHDVTSIFYNEERDELYVGTKSGMLYLWSL